MSAAGPGNELTVKAAVQRIIFGAGAVTACAALWALQPFALATELKSLGAEVEVIRTSVALASDVNELKSDLEGLKSLVRLIDVKAEMREISRQPEVQRSAYAQDRLAELETLRRQLERSMATL